MKQSDNTNAFICLSRARTKPCGYRQINSALMLIPPHHLNVKQRSYKMSTKTQKTDKAGDRPTHGLYVKSEQFGDPINMRFSAIWNNPEKGYMSLSPEKLQLKENPNAKENEPRFQLYLKTKIYGQDACVQIGQVTKEEQENCFEVNLGDLVIFENKPKEVKTSKKVVAQATP
ncbi:hypothetical protein [uncultured Winogradskyella sp.]|uniref:hypothetical protein n=1 Tax=uncultured Winogradskyella sp. TaxID=395353 RepID=UPI0026362DE6|nr:hypothetical protein [uncultured Winogradskyella sp.]